jgi:hypothetical protein
VLQRIEHQAGISVGRACGFASLAIATFMLGLSGDMVSAFKAGGFLTLVACLLLMIKARLAGARSYYTTEVWGMLSPQERPNAEVAQQVIGSVLRETFLRYALRAAFIAASLHGAAVVWALYSNTRI